MVKRQGETALNHSFPPVDVVMKYLIVNGDDFGASPGINRGILEAHQRGIVTSASLLVTTPWSTEAAALARRQPRLSIGLHADVGRLGPREIANSLPGLRAELRGQIVRFRELLGHWPTHLDSHHHIQQAPNLLPLFLELARDYDLPLREHSSVRHFASFYGQRGGQINPEQISVER